MPDTDEDDKAALRREMRALRRGLGATERAHRTERLWQRVVEGVRAGGLLEPGRVVMAFHGFDDEPHTDWLHEAIWASGARLALPRIEGPRVEPVLHERGGPLVEAVLGVPEPTGDPLDPTVVDIVIVPGLAFDRLGHRLGYGAGFYDRFLPDVRDDCRTVGVCFEPSLVDRLPTDPHDVPVDTVVTDETVLRPSGRARAEPAD
ncbi:MAG: 5-formyltetrahydrofolate cyclo-ligase [Actinomycetota bacterium]